MQNYSPNTDNYVAWMYNNNHFNEGQFRTMEQIMNKIICFTLLRCNFFLRRRFTNRDKNDGIFRRKIFSLENMYVERITSWDLLMVIHFLNICVHQIIFRCCFVSYYTSSFVLLHIFEKATFFMYIILSNSFHVWIFF